VAKQSLFPAVAPPTAGKYLKINDFLATIPDLSLHDSNRLKGQFKNSEAASRAKKRAGKLRPFWKS
jgi:hypothetical protein